MQRNKKSAGKRARRKTAIATKSGPDALQLLRQDHQAVSALFERYDALMKRGTGAQKAEVARKICDGLTIHAAIEEEIFYPTLRRGDPDSASLLDEAEVEHASLKDLVAQIQSGEPGSSLFDAKVKVLGEYVKHHVKEEQSEMFAAARAAGLDLKTLGAHLAERKAALQR